MRREIAAALLLVVAAACSHEGGEEGARGTNTGQASGHPTETITVTPVPPPPGVHLSFVQSRSDEGTDLGKIRVVNGTARGIRVNTLGLDWPGYPHRMQRSGELVPPGFTLDLPYDLPPPVCDADSATTPYAVITAGGRRLRRPVDDEGVRFLTRIWGSSCDRRRVARTAGIRIGDHWRESGRGDDRVLTGSLIVTRRQGAATVRITQLQGSVLFELALGGHRRVLGRDTPRVRMPLRVRSGGRCDPHSRGQSTQTFLFRVWVALGWRPAVAVTLTPARRQQARMLAFLDRACG